MNYAAFLKLPLEVTLMPEYHPFESVSMVQDSLEKAMGEFL